MRVCAHIKLISTVHCSATSITHPIGVLCTGCPPCFNLIILSVLHFVHHVQLFLPFHIKCCKNGGWALNGRFKLIKIKKILGMGRRVKVYSYYGGYV